MAALKVKSRQFSAYKDAIDAMKTPAGRFRLLKRRGDITKKEVKKMPRQLMWGQSQGDGSIDPTRVPFTQTCMELWTCREKVRDAEKGEAERCQVRVKIRVLITFPEYEITGDIHSLRGKRRAAAMLRRRFGNKTIQECLVSMAIIGDHNHKMPDVAALSSLFAGVTIRPKAMNPRNRVVESLQIPSSTETSTPTRISERLVPPSAHTKLLLLCGQTEPVDFRQALPTRVMSKCRKIGEGVYGEVYSSTQDGQNVAIKITPIEGDFAVNDEPQKKFAEILPEIVIAKELSNLRLSKAANTRNFCEVLRVSLVRGKYPSHLIRQWDQFHKTKGSENDRPDMFPSTQLYVLFVFSDCGRDLASFQFDSMDQARSVLAQVTHALAVAEHTLQFEHRDLHWGNVLVRPTEEEVVRFRLKGRWVDVPTMGVEANIIDFTLSRLSKDGMAVFSDLSTDDALFEGKGDPQFDVYRNMKIENGNNWETFVPFTNVLWLHYLAEKLVKGKQYTDHSSRQGRNSRRLFRQFFSEMLNNKSACEMAVKLESLLHP